MARSTLQSPFVVTLSVLAAGCGSETTLACPTPSQVTAGAACSVSETLRCRDANSCGIPIDFTCRNGVWAQVTMASCNPPRDAGALD